MGTKAPLSVRQWMAAAVLLAVGCGLLVWLVWQDDPVRPSPRRAREPESPSLPMVHEPPPEAEARPSEPLPPPETVHTPAVPEHIPLPAPPPPELLEASEIHEIRIELPVRLHLAGHGIVGAAGPDMTPNRLPAMLGGFLARGGWEDPGFELDLDGGGKLYIPANNRITSLEAVVRRETMTGSQWSALVRWAHGFQENAAGIDGKVAAEPSRISLVPRLRTAVDREPTGADDRHRVRGADELDTMVDPPAAYPASPTFVGLLRIPVGVSGATAEKRRPGRGAADASQPDPATVARRLLVALATHELDLARVDAPGMAVGFGTLSHPALNGPLPMVNPKVMCSGDWAEKDPAIPDSAPQKSEFIQHYDRFFWYIWEDVRRITAITPNQLSATGKWRLWTLKDALNAESEFLAIGLGRPNLAGLALDFGTVAAPGTLLRVVIARGPAPMPLELAELPVGVHLDILVLGPKREKRLPEPAQVRRHSYEPLPVLEYRALSHFLHAMPVKPTDWEHVVFIPGQHTRIHGSAYAPAHTGVRWKETFVDPVPDGETVLALPQAWQGGITATATWSGVPVPDASYVVLEAWQSPPESGVYFPEKYGYRVSAADTRHQWRLGSSLYGERFSYPVAPSLSDWEYMYGTGKRWEGVHQVRVAEELRTNFLAHARVLHRGLQVPEAAVHLMWREAGPRLEESEMANVGKQMPRQPTAVPPMLTVYDVREDAFEQAREFSMWPPSYRLPSPIEEKKKGPYPIGTNRCLNNGTWVVAAHRDYGFGFVFIPIGTKTDVTIPLTPWSAIGWDWKYIPRGHWPDGTPSSYNPPSQADPKAPEAVPPPSSGTPANPGR